MLELDGLTKVFKTGMFGKEETVAVSNVSLTVQPGEVVSLIGESGSGKTTVGRMILRLDRADGRCRSGSTASTSRPSAEAGCRRYYAHVQGVFQDPFSSYNPVYKVDRVLGMVRSSYLPGLSATEWKAKLSDSLEAVSLEPRDVLGKYPHQMSGGQLQRLMIARALLLELKFLVADEIISMLDASTRIDVLNLLGDLKARGVGILFITHDLSLGNYISDKTLILRHGKIAELGPTTEGVREPEPPVHAGAPRLGAAAAPEVDDDPDATRSRDDRPVGSSVGEDGLVEVDEGHFVAVDNGDDSREPDCVAAVHGSGATARRIWPERLRRTAALGVEGVELHDLYGHSAEEFRRCSTRTGSLPVAAIPGWRGSRTSSSRWSQSSARSAWTGSSCRGSTRRRRLPRPTRPASGSSRRRSARPTLGLRFGFHNHDGELRVLEDGRTLLDRLLDVSADLLFLEVDLGWVWYAGGDPMAFVEQLGKRAPLLHVKDMQKDGGAVHVPLGAGSLDYSRFAEVVERAGTEWLILEQDESEGPAFDSVESSVAALQQILGA